MNVFITPPLQPLRIPSGWCITYNQFFAVDPDDTIEAYEGIWWNFTEDMLQLHDHAQTCLIDLGWYPSARPDGTFRLVQIPITAGDADWEQPLRTYESQSRMAIVDCLEAWLQQSPAERGGR